MITTKGLKKIAQDDKKTTLQHPDGHTITIAHSKLKPEHAAALLKLPMHGEPQRLADGGEVKAQTDEDNRHNRYYGGDGKPSVPKEKQNNINGAQLTQPATWFAHGGLTTPVNAEDDGDDMAAPTADVASMADSSQNSTPTEDPAAGAARAPLQPLDDVSMMHNQLAAPALAGGVDSDGQAVASSQNTEPALSNMPLNAPASGSMAPVAQPSTKGIDSQIAGYQTLAKNQADIAKNTQQAQDDNAAAQAQLSSDFQSHYNDLQQESQAAYKAFSEGHIDPDHYMSSLSTGGKVATAIGLILGGIGGGMTHQANPALEFLNKQIDRDIDAQKANVGKQATLFSMLKEKMGSEIAGTAATKAMMTDALVSKIQAEANKHGGQDAMAKAQIAIGPLLQQKEQYMQQASILKSAKDVLSSGNPSPAMQGQATRAYLQAAGAKPEEIGKAQGELAEIQGVNSLQNDYSNTYQKLSHMALAGSLTPGKRAALITPIVNQLQMKIDHRFNEGAVEKLSEALFPSKADFASTDATKNEAASRLFETARAASAPTLNSYGIPIPRPKPVGTPVKSIK